MDQIENQARKLTRRLSQHERDEPVLSELEREIALTLDQMDGARQLHEQQRRSLLRQECYVDTDLLVMNRLRYPTEPMHDHRDRLKQRLSRIERERRELAGSQFERLTDLQDRLFSLMQRHRQIEGVENGHG